jgi:hypothetical protein
MNTKKNILFGLVILCSTNNIFSVTNNTDRYITIVNTFNQHTNSFAPNFIANDQDIHIIQQHKQSLENRLSDYQTSWAPMLLKLAAVGFGVEAGLSAMHSSIYVEAGLNRLTDTGNSEIARLVTSTHPIAHYIISAIYPIHYASTIFTNPITTKLYNMFFKQRVIDIDMYDLGMSAVYITRTLANAVISKYLFNKAASYKTEIETLTKEIELDTAMITSLKSQ